MKHAVVVPRELPGGMVVDIARRAEDGGLDELWVIEDYGYTSGTSLAAAALAVTERITVGIGILPAVVRNAAFTAMELTTLAELVPVASSAASATASRSGWASSASARRRR